MATTSERANLIAIDGDAGHPVPVILAAFDLAADGIAILDIQGPAARVTLANAALAERMRVERAGLSGRTLASLLDPEAAERAELAARRAVQSGAPQRLELHLYDAQGFPWWAKVLVRRLQGAGSENLCVATFTDISSRRFFDDVTGAVPINMLILDRSLTIRWINPVAARALGHEPREVIGRSLLDTVPEARERQSIYARVLAGESVDCEPHTFTARPDLKLVLANMLRPLHGRNGSVEGMIIVARDATADVGARGRLELALRSGNVGTWEYDLQTRESRLDERFMQLLGVTAEQWSAHPNLWLERLHRDDAPRVRRASEALVSGAAQEFDEEFRLQSMNGEWLWLHGHTAALARDADGRALRIVGTIVDVTHTRAATEALKDSEAMLRALIDNSPDRLLLLDRRGLIRFANRVMRARTPAELVGQDATQLADPSVRERLRAACIEVLERQIPRVVETEEPGPGGVLRNFEYHAAPVISEGRSHGISIRISEMTQQRKADEALRRQARIIEVMREAVLLIAPDGRVRLANPAADRMFGFEPGALVGVGIDALGLAGDGSQPGDAQRGGEAGGAARLRAALALARAAASEHVPREWLARHRDGHEFAVEVLFTRDEFQGEQLLIGVLQDLTASRQLERTVVEASVLEQQRISSDLHDGLGQELTAISLLLRAAGQRLGREYPPGKSIVEEIVTLVDRALDSARTLARGFSPVVLERGGLPGVLADLAARVRHVHGVRVQFRQALHAPLRIDATAANHLFRIAQEGIDDAIRHGKASLVTLRLTVEPTQLRLEVRDNGRGARPVRPDQGSITMRIMEYRARLLGGELYFERPARGGTVLCCACPQPAG